MPGTYEITLQQTFTTSDLEEKSSLCFGKCFEKYCEEWFWDNLASDAKALTWDDVQLNADKEKRWEYQPISESDSCFSSCLPPCIESHCLSWNWRNLETIAEGTSWGKNLTWGETETGGSHQKIWDFVPVSDSESCYSPLLLPCFQKYCKSWSWRYMKTDAVYSTTWAETKSAGTIPKKWAYESLTDADPCNISTTTIVSETSTISITKGTVQIFEIPPLAVIHTPSINLSGSAPFQVTLSADRIQCGSFPLEKIDWDFFGDGNILTVSRLQTPPESFTYSDAFPTDPTDPRNYQARITFNEAGVFYPSLTAYSRSTGSSSSCSALVGPVLPFSQDSAESVFRVVKSTKDLIALEIDQNLHFYTKSDSDGISEISYVAKTPSNPLRSVL